MRTHWYAPWIIALVLWFIAGCGGTPPPAGGGAGLTAPSDVTTTAGVGFVAVSWSHDGTGVSGFEISRSDTASTGSVSRAAGATVLGTVPAAARAYVDRSAAAGGSYVYSVRALGPGGGGSSAGQQTAPSVSPESGTFNPDPTRYLAIRVLDEQGEPMTNARVEFQSSVGGFSRSASTDDDGVVLLLDTAVSWQPAMVLTGNLLITPGWADDTLRPRLVPFVSVTHPGTIEDDPRTGELFDVTMTVEHAGTIESAVVQLALPNVDRPRWRGGFRVSETGVVEAQVAPGSYPILVSAKRGDAARFVVLEQPLTVAGPTSRAIDTATITLTSTLTFGVRTELDVDWSFCPFPVERDALQAEVRLAYCWGATTYSVMAARYRPVVNLSYDDDVTGRWSYRLEGRDPYDLRTVGTTVDVIVGEALTASFDTDRLSYAAGEQVRVVGGLADASGYTVISVYAEASGSLSATLTITNPDATIIHVSEVGLRDIGPDGDWSYTLDSAAPTGTYEVNVTFETGPLAGVVDVTTSIEVSGP